MVVVLASVAAVAADKAVEGEGEVKMKYIDHPIDH